jgi:hypothetical protein
MRHGQGEADAVLSIGILMLMLLAWTVRALWRIFRGRA